jgi:hypothetical protein
MNIACLVGVYLNLDTATNLLYQESRQNLTGFMRPLKKPGFLLGFYASYSTTETGFLAYDDFFQ